MRPLCAPFLTLVLSDIQITKRCCCIFYFVPIGFKKVVMLVTQKAGSRLYLSIDGGTSTAVAQSLTHSFIAFVLCHLSASPFFDSMPYILSWFPVHAIVGVC